MLRLIGFLFGVVVALVLLAALVDAPTRERAGGLVKDSLRVFFDRSEPKPTRPGPGIAAPTSDAAVAPVPAPEPAAPAPLAASPLAVSAPVAMPEPPIERPQAPVVHPDSAGLAQAPSTEPQAEMPPGESSLLQAPSEPQKPQPGWHPLWQTFRSKLSAKGFAGELQRLTGQRYRVRRTSPWAYQVELAYADARQRDAVLQEIRRKTGLGLPEAQP